MQYAFQHIPKSAGTSFQTTLGYWFGKENVLHCEHDIKFPSIDPAKFRAATCLIGHLSTALLRQTFNPAQIATCLRSPVERVVSTYFYWRAFFADSPHKIRSRYYKTVDPTTDPWDDILYCLGNADIFKYLELRNFQTWQLGYDANHRDISDSRALKLAKEWIRGLGCVGFTEDYPAFVSAARQYFRINGEDFVASENVNHGRPAAEEIPDYVREKIEVANALDIELYHYARECWKPKARRRTVPRDVKFNPRLSISHLKKDVERARVRLAGLFTREDFVNLNKWCSLDQYTSLVATVLLQQTERETRQVWEIRPGAGGNLAAIAFASGLPLEFSCADFSNVSGRIIRSVEMRPLFSQAVETYISPAKLAVFGDTSELMAYSRGQPGSTADIILTSLPLSGSGFRDELRGLEQCLSRFGFLIVPEAFNRAWPHVTSGIIEYLSAKPSLAPLCIWGTMLILAKKTEMPYWKTKMRAFLDQIVVVKEVEITELVGQDVWMVL